MMHRPQRFAEVFADIPWKRPHDLPRIALPYDDGGLGTTLIGRVYLYNILYGTGEKIQ